MAAGQRSCFLPRGSTGVGPPDFSSDRVRTTPPPGAYQEVTATLERRQMLTGRVRLVLMAHPSVADRARR